MSSYSSVSLLSRLKLSMCITFSLDGSMMKRAVSTCVQLYLDS